MAVYLMVGAQERAAGSVLGWDGSVLSESTLERKLRWGDMYVWAHSCALQNTTEILPFFPIVVAFLQIGS